MLASRELQSLKRKSQMPEAAQICAVQAVLLLRVSLRPLQVRGRELTWPFEAFCQSFCLLENCRVLLQAVPRLSLISCRRMRLSRHQLWLPFLRLFSKPSTPPFLTAIPRTYAAQLGQRDSTDFGSAWLPCAGTRPWPPATPSPSACKEEGHRSDIRKHFSMHPMALMPGFALSLKLLDAP